MKALIRLKLETTSRDLSTDEVSYQLAVYAERLAAYPIEKVERALRWWPTKSRWWPAWKDLQDELPEIDLHAEQNRITDARVEQMVKQIANGMKRS